MPASPRRARARAHQVRWCSRQRSRSILRAQCAHSCGLAGDRSPRERSILARGRILPALPSLAEGYMRRVDPAPKRLIHDDGRTGGQEQGSRADLCTGEREIGRRECAPRRTSRSARVPGPFAARGAPLTPLRSTAPSPFPSPPIAIPSLTPAPRASSALSSPQRDRHAELGELLLQAETAPDDVERMLSVVRVVLRLAMDVLRPGGGYADLPVPILGLERMSHRVLPERYRGDELCLFLQEIASHDAADKPISLPSKRRGPEIAKLYMRICPVAAVVQIRHKSQRGALSWSGSVTEHSELHVEMTVRDPFEREQSAPSRGCRGRNRLDGVWNAAATAVKAVRVSTAELSWSEYARAQMMWLFESSVYAHFRSPM